MDQAFGHEFLKQLGITIPVAAAVTLALFKFVGGKIIDAKFQREKIEFQRRQNEELERLKMDINASLSRTARLHQHEFEALPEAWRLLHAAFGYGKTVLGRGITVVKVENMTDEEFAEFLLKQTFTDTQKAGLKKQVGVERQESYERLKEHGDLYRADVAWAEVHNYLLEKGIFIQADIRAKMKEATVGLAAALAERRMAFHNPAIFPVPWEKSDKIMTDYPAIILELEAEVHGRLWDTSVP